MLGFLANPRWRTALPMVASFSNSNLKWYLATCAGSTVFLLAYYKVLEIALIVIVVPVMHPVCMI